MIEGAVYDPNGLVAVKYHQPIPKLLHIGDVSYYFDCRFGVSLAFVPEHVVPALLAQIGGCCGGKKHIISLASQVSYSHWKDGKGGR
jgi:hypothetical protein